MEALRSQNSLCYGFSPFVHHVDSCYSKSGRRAGVEFAGGSWLYLTFRAYAPERHAWATAWLFSLG